MTKLRLTLACTLSDRTRPILDGRVEVPGVEFVALPGEPEDIFRRALRDRAFEVSELSMGSHITTTARGEGKRTFAHTPGPSESRCVTHRSMPRVGTATTSGANGSPRPMRPASTSTRRSARSARWMVSIGSLQ